MARSDRPDLRRAYRAAWRDQVATGDASDVVLRRRLELEGIIGLSPGAEEAVLRIWRRGVPPRRLVWELVKGGAGPLLTAFAEVARALWGPESASLSFVPGLPESDLLVLSDSWEEDGESLRVAEVELHAVDEPQRFEVWHDGGPLGRGETESGEPEPGAATLYLSVSGGVLDADDCWVDQP